MFCILCTFIILTWLKERLDKCSFVNLFFLSNKQLTVILPICTFIHHEGRSNTMKRTDMRTERHTDRQI